MTPSPLLLFSPDIELAHFLSSSGLPCDIEHTTRPAACMRSFQASPPDLLILDASAKHVARSLLKAILDRPMGALVPCLILDTDFTEESIESWVSEGASEVCLRSSPYGENILNAALQMLGLEANHHALNQGRHSTSQLSAQREDQTVEKEPIRGLEREFESPLSSNSAHLQYESIPDTSLEKTPRDGLHALPSPSAPSSPQDLRPARSLPDQGQRSFSTESGSLPYVGRSEYDEERRRGQDHSFSREDPRSLPSRPQPSHGYEPPGSLQQTRFSGHSEHLSHSRPNEQYERTSPPSYGHRIRHDVGRVSSGSYPSVSSRSTRELYRDETSRPTSSYTSRVGNGSFSGRLESAQGNARLLSSDVLRRKLHQTRHEDYFAILEIRKGASNSDIEEAYQRISERFQAEHVGYPLMDQYFHEVREIQEAIDDAFAVLSHREVREEYLDSVMRSRSGES